MEGEERACVTVLYIAMAFMMSQTNSLAKVIPKCVVRKCGSLNVIGLHNLIRGDTIRRCDFVGASFVLLE